MQVCVKMIRSYFKNEKKVQIFKINESLSENSSVLTTSEIVHYYPFT